MSAPSAPQGKGWLLVTGFGPFPGVPSNPTERLAARLDGSTAGPFVVRARVLEVSFEGASAGVREALDAGPLPRAVVHFGVASGDRTLRVERRAVNLKHAEIPDATGASFSGVAIEPAHALDASLRTRLDADALAAHLVAEGHPTRPSDDAGRYVCNATYYRSLAHLDALGVPCVFVHVPDVGAVHTDPGGAPWTDARLEAAARAALAWLAKIVE